MCTVVHIDYWHSKKVYVTWDMKVSGMLGRVGVCAAHSTTRQTNTASFSIVGFSEDSATTLQIARCRVRGYGPRWQRSLVTRFAVQDSCACAHGLLIATTDSRVVSMNTSYVHIRYSTWDLYKGVNYKQLFIVGVHSIRYKFRIR